MILTDVIGQTISEASLMVHVLIDRLSEHEYEVFDIRTPARTTTTSTSAVPKPPRMISTGTMPQTPTMKSTGTMPATPMIKSTGTMPQSPQVRSIGTMPMTPTATASPVGIVTIDLCTPSTIDLCSPNTPTDNDTPQ